MRFLSLVLALLFFPLPAPPPALAESGHYYNAALQALEEMAAEAPAPEAKVLQPVIPEPEEMITGRKTVTSVSSCLKKLPEHEALDIRRTSIKPYEDCQKRLQKMLKDKKEASDKEAVPENDAETETPMNFVRVTEPEKKVLRKKAPGKKPFSGPDAFSGNE